MTERIASGDILICYMTRLSRWVGALEVIDGPFIDSTPIFLPENDPFVVRFRVCPVVWLDVDANSRSSQQAITSGSRERKEIRATLDRRVTILISFCQISAQTAVSDLPNSTNSPLFMLVTDVAGFDQIRPGIPKGLNPI